MLNISEVERKIIDLSKSVVDDTKTNKEKGLWYFHKKTYYQSSVDLNSAPWKFTFIRNDPMDIAKARSQMMYDFVAGDGSSGYVPEGCIKNAEGNWQFGDVILMRCPIREYYKRKIQAKQFEANRLGTVTKKFEDDAKAVGAGLRPEDKERLQKRVDQMDDEDFERLGHKIGI